MLTHICIHFVFPLRSVYPNLDTRPVESGTIAKKNRAVKRFSIPDHDRIN
jgi:hypothetical protein